jgi:hypothetical protein
MSVTQRNFVQIGLYCSTRKRIKKWEEVEKEVGEEKTAKYIRKI